MLHVNNILLRINHSNVSQETKLNKMPTAK